MQSPLLEPAGIDDLSLRPRCLSLALARVPSLCLSLHVCLLSLSPCTSMCVRRPGPPCWRHAARTPPRAPPLPSHPFSECPACEDPTANHTPRSPDEAMQRTFLQSVLQGPSFGGAAGKPVLGGRKFFGQHGRVHPGLPARSIATSTVDSPSSALLPRCAVDSPSSALLPRCAAGGDQALRLGFAVRHVLLLWALLACFLHTILIDSIWCP